MALASAATRSGSSRSPDNAPKVFGPGAQAFAASKTGSANSEPARPGGAESNLFSVALNPGLATRARDVTADVQARHALAATETRYQELFSRIPTPLVLHRNGRVIDANAAGVALFGYDNLGAMLGRDLLASYESGDSRERERRRIEELDRRPPRRRHPVPRRRRPPARGAAGSPCTPCRSRGGLRR